MNAETGAAAYTDQQVRLALAAVHPPAARRDVSFHNTAMRLPPESRRLLMMRHHGNPTVGAAAREAISPVNEFVCAAAIRLRMKATGPAALEIAPEVCEHGAAQYELHDRGRASADWPAYLRQLDRIDTSNQD